MLSTAIRFRARSHTAPSAGVCQSVLSKTLTLRLVRMWAPAATLRLASLQDITSVKLFLLMPLCISAARPPTAPRPGTVLKTPPLLVSVQMQTTRGRTTTRPRAATRIHRSSGHAHWFERILPVEIDTSLIRTGPPD